MTFFTLMSLYTFVLIVLLFAPLITKILFFVLLNNNREDISFYCIEFCGSKNIQNKIKTVIINIIIF